MRNVSRAGLAALLLACPLAVPALAADEAPPIFDQRVRMEWQSWNWVGTGATKGNLGYSTPMTIFTVTDRSGALLGAATNVATNEANRRAAEREAIRKGEYRYSYDVAEAHALEGTRFSFSVGMGNANGIFAGGSPATLASTAGVVAKMARLDLEGDIVELGGGSFVFTTGIASWSAGVPGAIVTNNSFNLGTFDWPLGIKYRWSPSFLPGLVIQPEASFNWLYTAYTATNGSGTKWDAHNVGVDVGYYVLPTVKIHGSYFLNSQAHDKVDWMQESDMVDMKAASLGVMATF